MSDNDFGEQTQFELDMLTCSFMFSMPYEEAVVAARKELREMREADKLLMGGNGESLSAHSTEG